MKRIIASLLVFAVLITSMVFTASALSTGITLETGADNTNIRIGEELFPVTVNETYTYEYRMSIGKRLTAIDAELTYDTDGLELVSYEFPSLGNSNVFSGEYESALHFNYLNTGGVSLASNVLIRASFRIKATGTHDVKMNIIDMCRYQEVKIVENETVLSDFSSEELMTDSDDKSSSIYIQIDDKYYKVKRNGTYTYTCYFKTNTRVGTLNAYTYLSGYLYNNQTYIYTRIYTTSGRMFDTDDSILLSLSLKVDPSTINGIYDIRTSISNVLDINDDIISDYTYRAVLEGMEYITERPNQPTGPYVMPSSPPTQAPTQRPTSAPTAPPTQRPTQAQPTQVPTQAPTQVMPTASPPQPTTQPSTQPYNYDLIGDVDNDGDVTSLDITYIQRWLVNYSVQYPIGEKRN